MNTTFETSYFAVRISSGHDALIEVSGDLDLAAVAVLDAALQKLDLRAARRVVLDLRRLAFIDAAGLHAVLDLHAACLNGSAALTIVPGPWNVQRVFELTGADQLLAVSSG